MKYSGYLICILTIFEAFNAMGQQSTCGDIATNLSPTDAQSICDDYMNNELVYGLCDCIWPYSSNLLTRNVTINGILQSETYEINISNGLYYHFHVFPTNYVNVSIIFSGIYETMGVEIHGPFAEDDVSSSTIENATSILYGQGIESPDGTYQLNTVINLSPGHYYIVYFQKNCSGNVSNANVNIDFSTCFNDCCSPPPPPPPCSCIESFSPIPGEKYLISGWVKEKDQPLNTLHYGASTISVEYTPNGLSGITFSPQGSIIDGWQRIEGVFTIPSSAETIKFNLNSTHPDGTLFDDIRVQPFNSSMKTFVYDPITMRMVAAQDERNYSTLYEYDEEGRLSRVKKETERGIQTVQSIRQNTAIK